MQTDGKAQGNGFNQTHFAVSTQQSGLSPTATTAGILARSITRITWTADQVPVPRAVGIFRSFKPAAIADTDAAQTACSSVITGARSGQPVLLQPLRSSSPPLVLYASDRPARLGGRDQPVFGGPSLTPS